MSGVAITVTNNAQMASDSKNSLSSTSKSYLNKKSEENRRNPQGRTPHVGDTGSEAVEFSLQTTRALIGPMLSLAASASKRFKNNKREVRRSTVQTSIISGEYSAEERRKIRAERKAMQEKTKGTEVDVWGQAKKERYDLPELCEYDEETYDHFEVFCATRIQACWRMFIARQKYRRLRWAVITIQRCFRVWGFIMRPKKLKLNDAATRIQRAWRSLIQKRTFSQIRDIIRFRGSGDPAFLLKVLSPAEADFADEASGVHIRFRLTGCGTPYSIGSDGKVSSNIWPPVILYKVFTHRNIADIGAFAPRDYEYEMQKKREAKRENSKKDHPEDERTLALYDKDSRKRWYQRDENNGWRPLSEQAFGAMVLAKEKHEDKMGISKGPKINPAIIKRKPPKKQEETKFFHPLRSHRIAEKQRRARKRQSEWMRKMSMMNKANVVGERDEDMRDNENITKVENKNQGLSMQAENNESEIDENSMDKSNQNPEKSYDNYLENLIDEESDLLAWTTALDYEAYLTDWHSNATTISTEMRRSKLGYDSWLAIREAQEKMTDFEFSFQDNEHSQALRRGSGSIASIYSDEYDA